MVKLLLLATEKLMEATPYEVVVGWRDPSRHTLLQLEPLKGEIQLYGITAKNRYKKIQNTTCINGQIRPFTGTGFTAGIRVTKNPWKVITLKKSTAVEWIPILKELVNVQRKIWSRKTHIDGENWMAVVSVSIPFPMAEQKSWAEILDEKLKERSDSVDQKSQSTTAEEKVGERSDIAKTQKPVTPA